MSGMNTKKLVFLSLAAAFAIVFGWLESFIPLPLSVPYIKLGLGNVVIVSILYCYTARDAFFVSLIKILMSSFLFSGFGALPYSLAGGMLSLIAMVLLKKSGLFGAVGVSVAGGTFHMLGQILVAAVVIENIDIMFFMSPLLIAGAATGVCVGVASALMTRQLGLILKDMQ